jgi:glycosyl transferase family 25
MRHLTNKYVIVLNKMFTVNLKGGLGNQLYQIAFLEYLTQHTGIDFFIRSSDIDRHISEHSHVSYFNSIFNNWIGKSNSLPIEKVICETDLQPQDWIQIANDNKHLTIEFDGYFQNYKYITHEFINKLLFPTDFLNIYLDIKDGVFIHIRGGDYVNHSLHDVKLTEYYQLAVGSFPEDTHFFVFTNDVTYSESILKTINIKYTLISEIDTVSLYLMSQCKAGICANSSFSWWGAYLNKNRQLMLPSSWFNNINLYTDGYYFPEASIVDFKLWNFLDKAVYINLEHRTDRNEHMKTITQSLGNKAIRFNAIKDTFGPIGCTKSHIEVLKLAINNNWENVLIMEDDVEWNMFDNGYSILKNLIHNSYDVILLGGSFVSYDQITYKLNHAKTTTAYIVNKHYMRTLLQNFEEGLSTLISNTELFFEYAIDAYWSKLQIKDNWFIVQPPLVYQRPDYSDICQANVDYRNLMNIEIPVRHKQPLIRYLNINH